MWASLKNNLKLQEQLSFKFSALNKTFHKHACLVYWQYYASFLLNLIVYL